MDTATAAPALLDRCARAFHAHFNKPPTLAALAPGRVNLIGDHTDYNQGLALPMAIDRWTAIAAAPRTDNEIHAGSALGGQVLRIENSTAAPAWTTYIRGTLELTREAGLNLGGLDLWIESDIPTGAGLSSSAALCVALATLIEHATGITLGHAAKARLCQRVEHEYAKVPCGIMDQTIIAAAHEHTAMLLDCRSMVTTYIPFDGREVRVLIADTGVSRALASSAYAARRAECEAAAAFLGVQSLRDAPAPTEEWGTSIPLRRARHVVTENARVQAFAEAIRARDWPAAGHLMDQSHDSLQGDFDITGPALDALIQCARDIGQTSGVLGSRMTGAGMGGCAVLLVRADAADDIAARILPAYSARTGNIARVFPVRPVAGASAATPPIITH